MTKLWRILLADDDMDDRFFFEKALKELPFPTKLSTAQDGETLMQMLADNPNELPDVIFLDLNMPRKNGSECLSEIKADKTLQHIPVVIYSTSLHEEAADLLYRNGAHYYLQKCDFAELPGAISKILNMLAVDPDQPARENFIVRTLVTLSVFPL